MISLHFIGITIGNLLNFKISRKFRHVTGFLFFLTLLVAFYISLLIINQPWFVFVGLFGAGITLGCLSGFIVLFIASFLGDRKQNGRLFATGYILISLFIIVGTVIDLTKNVLLEVLYFIFLLGLFSIFLLIGKSDLTLPPQKAFNARKYIRQKSNLPITALGFFWGFFFVNAYYVTILILDIENLRASLNIFVIILFLSIAASSLPVGILADTVGRRLSFLFGVCIQAFAFLLLSFSQDYFILIYIFPIILGFGFMLSISCGTLLIIESIPSEVIKENYYFIDFVHGIGLTFGVIIGEVIRPILYINTAYLTVILLFIFVIATVVVFQIEETLPSKEELEWKDALLEFFCIHSEKGICIYYHTFIEKSRTDQDLFAGGLSGVCALVQEITESEKRTEVIDQGDKKLLLEVGDYITSVLLSNANLKVLRQKLREITQEVEVLFEDVFPEWTGNVDIFVPIGSLVKKHFS